MRRLFKRTLAASICALLLLVISEDSSSGPGRAEEAGEGGNGDERVFAPSETIKPAPADPGEIENINIYAKRAPSVVNITNTTVSYDFFYNPLPKKGSGSGVVMDTDGNIITNYHVIKGARSLEVTLYDGSKFKARVVGADPSNDLSVIKIKAPAVKLMPIPLGDSSSLRVGQKVLAIGNPFGLDGTLTTGIISSLGRTLRTRNGVLMRGVIQTDAAINPGNSGGPLIDSSGLLVGINTGIFAPAGAATGIGFAIPVGTVKRVVPELIKKGRVVRPWLGIAGQTIGEELAKALGLPQGGVLVADVFGGSPADSSGLTGSTGQARLGNRLLYTGGDLIVEIDGRGIKSMDDISDMRERLGVGDTVTVKFVRDGTVKSVDMTLTNTPGEISF